METINIKTSKELKKKTNEIKSILSTIIHNHEKYNKAYFFTPPSAASARRNLEKAISKEYSIIIMNNKIDINQSLDCSCRNMYYHLSVYYNDQKKDIRLIKKIFDNVDESKEKQKYMFGLV